MTKISRRKALGLSTGLIGLAACASPTTAPARTAEAEIPATYEGQLAFEHGVASGDPMPESVVLWTRVTPKSGSGPVDVSWTVREGDALVAAGTVTTSAARDYTVKVVADGLRPGREYRYAFHALTPSGRIESPTGRTKTTAASGDTSTVKFAVISCSNWPFGYFNVYREIAAEEDLDAVIHLGDYIYEYGVDGYGGQVGEQLGRRHDPITEIVTLDDYRTRHAQYKSDPDLQAAHAAAPWLCTWDDHESTNNSYRTGAENHNPEDNEGDWSDRKQAAVQAYLEWMPVRDPEPGRAQEAIYRKFDFGDVVSVFCLESRLTGRSEEISWVTELGGVPPEQVLPKAAQTMMRVTADERTMLGAQQEDWLASGLRQSVQSGKAWQVLANQVVMARVRPPNFTQTLTPEQIAAQENPFIQQLIGFSQIGLPFNLDAWDGFPAARDRLYRSAQEAGARLVTLTGDTHTAWANTLVDMNGDQRGVEFGCTSVTSPGFGTYMTGVEGLGQLYADANPEVDFHDPHGYGFIRVVLTPSGVRGEFVKVSTITSRDYTVSMEDRFATRAEAGSMTPLQRV